MKSMLRACCASVLVMVCGGAAAQAFPDKPLKIIVPVAAGGGADTVTRVMAAVLSDRIGQPVVIENRGGAGGNVGMEVGARAPADGYNLTMVFQSMAANPFLYAKMPVDVVKDFAPVTHMVNYYLVMVVAPSVPASSVRELLALAKAKPGELTYGSSGAGGASHLAMEYFMSMTGTQFTHIPYKGNAPAMADLMGGRITAIVDALGGAISTIRSGKARALGVGSKQRSAALPDVPPIADSVPGFELVGWLGIAAPAGTPADRVAYWSKEIGAALNHPPVKQRLTDTGNEIMAGSPDEFGRFIQAELRKYEKLIRGSNIKANQ